MRKCLAILAVLLLLVGIARQIKASDSFVRERVVKLQSSRGSCTGIDVQAPSGKSYVLTASHCLILVENGKVEAVKENGQKETLDFIKEDPKSDLLLLSGLQGIKGIDIADGLYRHEQLHMIGHGAGADDYRTDGELIEERTATFAAFMVGNQAEFDKCSKMPKLHAEIEEIFLVCIMQTQDLLTTVPVVPGCSGGPLLDPAGHLAGIISGMDSQFSYMVRLSDVKAFMEKR